MANFFSTLARHFYTSNSSSAYYLEAILHFTVIVHLQLWIIWTGYIVERETKRRETLARKDVDGTLSHGRITSSAATKTLPSSYRDGPVLTDWLRVEVNLPARCHQLIEITGISLRSVL